MLSRYYHIVLQLETELAWVTFFKHNVHWYLMLSTKSMIVFCVFRKMKNRLLLIYSRVLYRMMNSSKQCLFSIIILLRTCLVSWLVFCFFLFFSLRSYPSWIVLFLFSSLLRIQTHPWECNIITWHKREKTYVHIQFSFLGAETWFCFITRSSYMNKCRKCIDFVLDLGTHW